MFTFVITLNHPSLPLFSKTLRLDDEGLTLFLDDSAIAAADVKHVQLLTLEHISKILIDWDKINS